MKKVSVLMSVYAKETPSNLKSAIESIFNQSVKPDELVIIEDGPLPSDLSDVLDSYANQAGPVKLRRYKLAKNKGLGLALRFGIEKCQNELIARMDSDDIASEVRLEAQLKHFEINPDTDILGSNIVEFIGSRENIVARRTMPETHAEIVTFSRRRNPFAHPSVMLCKSAALRAGNYREYRLCEDYDLWTRMIINGARCYNIQENLVSMRTSSDFYKRRGGFKYSLSITKFKFSLLRSGYSSLVDFLASSGSSLAVSLMPAFVRSWVYATFLRSKQPTKPVIITVKPADFELKEVTRG